MDRRSFLEMGLSLFFSPRFILKTPDWELLPPSEILPSDGRITQNPEVWVRSYDSISPHHFIEFLKGSFFKTHFPSVDELESRLEAFFPYYKQALTELYGDFPLEHRLPLDIVVFKDVQESGLDPLAVSIAGALGISQLTLPVIQQYAPDFSLSAYPDIEVVVNSVTVYSSLLKDARRSFNSLHRRAMNRLKEQNDDSLYERLAPLQADIDRLILDLKSLRKNLSSKLESLASDNPDFLPFQPSFSISTGARHLGELWAVSFDKLGNLGDWNFVAALSAYNAGPVAFDFHGLPRINETVGYVRNIMHAHYAFLDYLHGVL